MNLIIDIGNTVAKIAVFEAEEVVEVFYASNDSLDVLKEVCDKYPISRGILASVIDLNDSVSQKVSKLSFPLITLDSKTLLPIQNLYESPKTLGYDRIAAVVGAYTYFPGKDILVIDALRQA